MLFWKDVGNGILLYRPLPFKSHQGYQPLPCFIPAVGSREKQCGDDGDDLITAVASHYRGEAVMRLSSQPYPHVNFCKEMFSRMFMLSFSAVQWKHKVTRGCQTKYTI